MDTHLGYEKHEVKSKSTSNSHNGNNWRELATFFKYPPEIREIIYTTNIIESYHRQLRKVTKGKSIFPSD